MSKALDEIWEENKKLKEDVKWLQDSLADKFLTKRNNLLWGFIAGIAFMIVIALVHSL